MSVPRRAFFKTEKKKSHGGGVESFGVLIVVLKVKKGRSCYPVKAQCSFWDQQPLPSLIPLFHQGSSSASSVPVPAVEPVSPVLIDKEPALSRDKWFQSGTRSSLDWKEQTAYISGRGEGIL